MYNIQYILYEGICTMYMVIGYCYTQIVFNVWGPLKIYIIFYKLIVATITSFNINVRMSIANFNYGHFFSINLYYPFSIRIILYTYSVSSIIFVLNTILYY